MGRYVRNMRRTWLSMGCLVALPLLSGCYCEGLRVQGDWSMGLRCLPWYGGDAQTCGAADGFGCGGHGVARHAGGGSGPGASEIPWDVAPGPVSAKFHPVPTRPVFEPPHAAPQPTLAPSTPPTMSEPTMPEPPVEELQAPAAMKPAATSARARGRAPRTTSTKSQARPATPAPSVTVRPATSAPVNRMATKAKSVDDGWVPVTWHEPVASPEPEKSPATTAKSATTSSAPTPDASVSGGDAKPTPKSPAENVPQWRPARPRPRTTS